MLLLVRLSLQLNRYSSSLSTCLHLNRKKSLLFFVSYIPVKICFKVFESKYLDMVPFSAIEIAPDSSETIIAKQSDLSDIPMAALCRVPSSLLKLVLSVSGKKQAAAFILSSFIMTAPSCSGVFGIKILISKVLDTKPSILVPVSATSFNPVCLSKTIRAPIFCLDKEAVASTNSSTTLDKFSPLISKSGFTKTSPTYVF